MRIALLAALMALPLAAEAQQKEVLKVPGTVPGLPFSPAIRVGDVIYLSGAPSSSWTSGTTMR